MAIQKQMTGTELRGYRLALKFTQYQFAHVLGVPRGTVASWENGRGIVPLALRKPLELARRLADKQVEVLAGALSEAPTCVGERWT